MDQLKFCNQILEIQHPNYYIKENLTRKWHVMWDLHANTKREYNDREKEK